MAAALPSRLTIEDVEGVTVVNFLDSRITEELNIQTIGDELYQLAEERGQRKILLNFQNVQFMSTALLGKLITLNNKLQAVQGKLVLCEISDKLIIPFKLAKLDSRLIIVPDEQTGLRSF